MCTSCPQACITPTSNPWSFLVRTFEAYGSPVFSSTGSASSSVRSSTTGPLPFFNTPTMPILPTCSVTSYPTARSLAASVAAVRSSCHDNSGCACRSKYSSFACGRMRSVPALLDCARSAEVAITKAAAHFMPPSLHAGHFHAHELALQSHVLTERLHLLAHHHVLLQ